MGAPTTDSWGVVTEDTFKALGAMVLSGPLLCGFTQTCNDWFDKDLDAINEPYRPIPSGAISQNEVYFQIGALLVGGLALAFQLDQWAANDWPVLTFLAVLYSFAGLGIAIVNDFKSIEGDRALGMNSLPVAFGIEKAKWICVGTIDLTQLGVAAYLYAIGETTFALVLFGLILPQMFAQLTFIQNPVANDVKYQGAAQPFLVFGILTTALAVGHHTF